MPSGIINTVSFCDLNLRTVLWNAVISGRCWSSFEKRKTAFSLNLGVVSIKYCWFLVKTSIVSKSLGWDLAFLRTYSHSLPSWIVSFALSTSALIAYRLWRAILLIFSWLSSDMTSFGVNFEQISQLQEKYAISSSFIVASSIMYLSCFA